MSEQTELFRDNIATISSDSLNQATEHSDFLNFNYLNLGSQQGSQQLNPSTIERTFLNKIHSIKVESYTDRLVINLSDCVVSELERNVLCKGLTFCPTPGDPDMGDIKHDLDMFFRRMRLKLFFSEEHETIDTLPSESSSQITVNDSEPLTWSEYLERTFRKKSTWTPRNQDTILEAFIKAVTNDFYNMQPKKIFNKNLNKEEYKTISRLRNNDKIVIKKADKGSAVVIMNKCDYIAESLRQLSDQQFYIKLNESYTQYHIERITKHLIDIHGRGGMSKKVLEGLLPENCRTAKYYFLPKIHKSTITGRPIISGNQCPTEKISAFVDEHIKIFVPKIKSYIRDTSDFIQKISKVKLTGHCLLVTLDVTSLYTNIPNFGGLRAIARTLQMHSHNFQISDQDLLLLLKDVLHMNNFEFNGEEYLQVGGTAMGTKVAPSYANLFMARLEEKLLSNAPYIIPLYLRFIDDIFLLFPYPERDLELFMEYMNSQDRHIKFTEHHSPVSVVFPDVNCIREGDKLITDLHSKDTDTHSYLDYTSCHPKHILQNGPKGQFLRLRRNCFHENAYSQHADQLEQYYDNRGYPPHIVKKHRSDAAKKSQQTLLKQCGTKQKNSDTSPTRIPLVMNYNPRNPEIMQSIKKHWPLLQSSNQCKDLFKDPPIMAYRRPKNLKDFLVRAKLNNSIPHPPTTSCEREECAICSDLIKNPPNVHRITRKVIKHMTDINCCTENVVYLLTCTTCEKQYVGETKRQFRIRYKEHLADIKHNRDTPVAKHFNLQSHNPKIFPQPRILSAFKGSSNRAQLVRKNKEKQWIHLLQTTIPRGLNLME